jgi:antitoxin component of RelBE/YafQ-DinJ toxin-antitoxin module
MKNITLSVDEKVLAQARRYAAEHNTSINALVRQYLEQIAGNNERARQAMRELRAMSDRSTAEAGPVRWKRDDLHER